MLQKESDYIKGCYSPSYEIEPVIETELAPAAKTVPVTILTSASSTNKRQGKETKRRRKLLKKSL